MANLFLTDDLLPVIGQAIYPGINGFLGSPGIGMLDVVFLAMFLVLPVLGIGIGMARFRRQYTWHKRIQLAVAAILLLAVGAFEIDMQFVSGCANGAAVSILADGGEDVALHSPGVFDLDVFLVAVRWLSRLWSFSSKPPHPSPYSRRHVFWARVAAIDLVLTAITGWTFYWLAFVA